MIENFGTKASRDVLSLIERNGFEAVYVGGAVRDYLLGTIANDIDIATSALPAEIKEIFPHTIDVGIDHGTVLIVLKKESIEVTTYRTEGQYTDFRHPDAVAFVRNLREDLLRRDFTINAFALTLNGELIDLFDGKKDLSNKVIRAVGNPTERFKEDALRMVRAVRFSSTLDFTIETKTKTAIVENATQIQYVSVERIKTEMDKLFVGKNPVAAFSYIQETGLCKYLPLFPSSTKKLIATAPYQEPEVGWASLMIAGDFTPFAVVNAYKLSNAEKHFLLEVYDAYQNRREKLFTIDDYYRFDMSVLLLVENLNHCINPNGIYLTAINIERQKKSLPIQSYNDITISGKDLIEWTGESGGRWTSEWLSKIERAIVHGECENTVITIREWFLNEFKRER